MLELFATCPVLSARVTHVNSTRVQNFPEHQFPSIVGRPILRMEEQAGDIVVKDIMCGEEAAAARSMLQISYPVRLPEVGEPRRTNTAR
jgi:hypothetical protein